MRKLQGIYRAPAQHWVGDGFPVRSLFSYNGLGRQLSPFLLLDHAGPAEFSPAKQPRGVGSHPHRGFETVTIVYQGEVAHKDSTGAGGLIGPGEVQWMTAGGGIVHEEFHSQAFTERGGMLEMVQLWVNLPARDKLAPPSYQTLTEAQIPVAALPDRAGRVRVIAGGYGALHGPARTFTPIQVRDVRLSAGETVPFDVEDGHTLAWVVLHGGLSIGDNTVGAGQLAVFHREGSQVEMSATSDATVLWLSGEPIDEPIVGYGPFVMNSEAEIQQAIDDFNSGRFGRIAA